MNAPKWDPEAWQKNGWTPDMWQKRVKIFPKAYQFKQMYQGIRGKAQGSWGKFAGKGK